MSFLVEISCKKLFYFLYLFLSLVKYYYQHSIGVESELPLVRRNGTYVYYIMISHLYV